MVISRSRYDKCSDVQTKICLILLCEILKDITFYHENISFSNSVNMISSSMKFSCWVKILIALEYVLNLILKL